MSKGKERFLGKLLIAIFVMCLSMLGYVGGYAKGSADTYRKASAAIDAIRAIQTPCGRPALPAPPKESTR